MEKSLTTSRHYGQRARRSLAEARNHLKKNYLETAISTIYYGCFYAVHAQLARKGIEASSHKQAGIEFRRHFILNQKLPAEFSRIWQDLFEWRMEVDYAPTPDINLHKAKELVSLGEKFIKNLLIIKD